MNERIQRVKAMAAELWALFPEAPHIQLNASPCGIDLTAHLKTNENGKVTYDQATDFMRALGIGTRNKSPQDAGYTVMRGSVDGVEIVTFPDELPPSCHKVTFKEKIRKTQTVDTGEFIEVERTKIVCDGEHQPEAQPA